MGRENPEDRGIVVDVSNLGTPERARVLVDALKGAGITARLNIRTDAFPVDGVLIIVGSKP
jgi:NAD(P)H-hydrate repair Nnr-like enzyme with NAD(P)H-hydrate epimerase domain